MNTRLDVRGNEGHAVAVGGDVGGATPAPQIPSVADEQPEGLDEDGGSWGDYPIDDLLIRRENRTVYEVLRRIEQGNYVMDPEFQRDFIWPDDKQSKLIESVVMRIPLPVFYLAEDNEGRMIVVDGLQRLSTFRRFVTENELRLKLPDRGDLDGCRFEDLLPKYKNRIEDCNLLLYTIDPKVPERARLDIFERVNSGLPLSRQQMRNSLFMGEATRFLKEESQSDVFAEATDGGLNKKSMRDREFVNRFCAFHLLGLEQYQGDMDEFLAGCLRRMNEMEGAALSQLSTDFRRGLANNVELFGRHAFRKHKPDSTTRSVINAALWDVMTTELCRYEKEVIQAGAASLRQAMFELFDDEEFIMAITYASSGTRQVKARFGKVREAFARVLDA